MSPVRRSTLGLKYGGYHHAGNDINHTSRNRNCRPETPLFSAATSSPKDTAAARPPSADRTSATTTTPLAASRASGRYASSSHLSGAKNPRIQSGAPQSSPQPATTSGPCKTTNGHSLLPTQPLTLAAVHAAADPQSHVILRDAQNLGSCLRAGIHIESPRPVVLGPSTCNCSLKRAIASRQDKQQDSSHQRHDRHHQKYRRV